MPVKHPWRIWVNDLYTSTKNYRMTKTYLWIYFMGYIKQTLIARFMGPTWGPPGAIRTQVGSMFGHMNLAIWELDYILCMIQTSAYMSIIFPSRHPRAILIWSSLLPYKWHPALQKPIYSTSSHSVTHGNIRIEIQWSLIISFPPKYTK